MSILILFFINQTFQFSKSYPYTFPQFFPGVQHYFFHSRKRLSVFKTTFYSNLEARIRERVEQQYPGAHGWNVITMTGITVWNHVPDNRTD